MGRIPFKVGDVVMFFMQNGRLADPPSTDEIDEAMLCGMPCWTVISACSEQISVKSDAGTIIINRQDFSKIWCLGHSVAVPVKWSKKHEMSLLQYFNGTTPLPAITNIRPLTIVEA